VIFQFPYWWFSMPAMMKGWVERVFVYGFAYGVGGTNHLRYGNGNLKGKRAMLSITIGGPERDYSERGINGAIADLLFPIHHGILFFPGMTVLPPFLVYGAGRLTLESYEVVAEDYKQRLLTLDLCLNVDAIALPREIGAEEMVVHRRLTRSFVETFRLIDVAIPQCNQSGLGRSVLARKSAL
jgi:hypothetical protein